MNTVPQTRSFNYVDEMNAFCEALQKHPEIAHAEVNDFGFFDNFDIHIVPVNHDRFSTNRLKGIVKRELKNIESKKAHLRSCFSPEPRYEMVDDGYNSKKVKRIIGYNRNYWSFDIDYQQFNAESNRFC